MPTPLHLKLSYFDFAGSRGEECRLALHLAGLEFDDERLTFKDWAPRKASSPFGSMPVLHVEGKGDLAECNAILVYIGRRCDLHPSDPWQAALHEQLLSAGEGLRSKVFPVLSIKDESEGKTARQGLASGLLRTWGQGVEQLLGSGPFVAGDKIQVADLKLYMLVNWFVSGTVDHVPTDVFSPFPKLMALYHSVKSHPKITEWYSR
jgi:glutathione S-transferase